MAAKKKAEKRTTKGFLPAVALEDYPLLTEEQLQDALQHSEDGEAYDEVELTGRTFVVQWVPTFKEEK
jgi:hypothetical protein